MRYLALATDYDETIATRGHLGDDSKAALQRLRTSGRRAVLITDRILEDLLSVCPDLDLFAAVVLENGAVLHVPSRRETQVLCPPVSDILARELTLGEFAKRDEAIIWERSAGRDPYAAIIVPARSARLRHLRKYAEGNLGPGASSSAAPRRG